jgi:MoaA/NifB/PqqE/SkfB family radical SAM enzyme
MLKVNSYQKKFIRSLQIKDYLNFLFLYLAKFNDFFLNFVKITPLFATVKLTNLCNSRCITCGHWKNKSNQGEMTTQQVLNVEEQLYQAGCRFIRFSGGEALLRDDIKEIINHAKKVGFKKIILATNGLLLNKKAQQLSSLTDITISLDGTGSINDQIRGIDGYFENALKGIKTIKKLHPDVDIKIATTVLAKNIDNIFELLEFCKKNNIPWYLNLLDVHTYFWKEIKTNGLDPKEKGAKKVKKFIKKLKREKQQHPNLITLNNQQINHVKDFILQGKYPNHCILGYVDVYIDPKANVYTGCWPMDPLANLKKTNLKKLIQTKKYKNRAQRMFHRKCPQCTCGWAYNILYDNL